VIAVREPGLIHPSRIWSPVVSNRIFRIIEAFNAELAMLKPLWALILRGKDY